MNRIFAAVAGVLTLILAIATSGPAIADPALLAPAAASPDLAPALNVLFTLICTVVTGVGGFVLNLMRQKMHVTIDDQTRSYLDNALTNGVHFGLARAQTYLGTVDWTRDLHVKNQVVDQAVQYVNVLAPEAARRLGLDDPKLAVLIEARLAKMAGIADGSRSPASSPGLDALDRKAPKIASAPAHGESAVRPPLAAPAMPAVAAR